MASRESFSCRSQWEDTREQHSTILPARVANHCAGIGSPCPLMELAIVYCQWSKTTRIKKIPGPKLPETLRQLNVISVDQDERSK